MEDVLALTIARTDGTLGPKVKLWEGTCPAVVPALVFPAPRRPLVNPLPIEAYGPEVALCPTGYRAGGITLDGATMATAAEVLSLPPARAFLGTITVDRTGLSGRYTMELEYLFPVRTGAPPPEGASLSTVVLEQWGLRLLPAKSRINLFVIENAQPPTPN